ncbi:hypothetical protein BSL82_16670 [Tardibacter chloracetimidivorans]|uniref:Isochorismatase-like domain-containing protein n=1 Tax=Tardibacter chloracetimidivorans TaxID=1921510 RepID=A0A1L3ZYL5_9SPHN|nr:isochorismatase family cysteine hydrolase [Tardibacter chloracetimidivorans]API60721.1 hypothetical protein BSL82_16670 [Tardibacter chloracetimidivorans]
MGKGKDRPADPSAGSGAALLIIDMISNMDFRHADEIAAPAEAAARRIKALRAAATRAGLPVIYVNDNFGHWGMEWPRLVEMCEASGETAATLVRLLRPRKADLFIIKPMHSGFYATNLQALLPRLGVSRLILTGMATELCVLFTAADAHMRDYSLWTPADCVASSTADGGEFALRLLRRHMGVEVRPTAERGLEDWLESSASS